MHQVMKISIHQTVRLIAVAGVSLVTFSSCQSTPDEPEVESAITKVDYYHLKNVGEMRESQDPMIYTESSYYLHGALTNQERAARLGNYYTVYWKSDDKVSPVTVKFQYTQAGTGSEVKVQEQTLTDHKGKGRTKFNILGDDYRKNGRVISWKATVTQNGVEIGSQASFLWK